MALVPGKTRHNKSILREIGYRYLSGEQLKALASEYGISYRVLRFHSASNSTGFYVKDFYTLKGRRYDGILMFRGKRLPLIRKMVKIEGKVMWSYVLLEP